jgi:hypothetical protein
LTLPMGCDPWGVSVCHGELARFGVPRPSAARDFGIPSDGFPRDAGKLTLPTGHAPWGVVACHGELPRQTRASSTRLGELPRRPVGEGLEEKGKEWLGSDEAVRRPART